MRLTGLYLLAALLLVGLVGGGAYGLLRYYFQTTTDLALRHRMAQEFSQLDAPLPRELAASEERWLATRALSSPSGSGSRERDDGSKRRGDEHDRDDDDDDRREAAEPEDGYDSELASIFVLPLSSDGTLLFNPNASAPPFSPDRQAAAVALAGGSDLRTVRSGNTSFRLLTYRVTRAGGPALLQLGRPLDEQERVASQLLMGLLLLGGASTALLGAGSWWLAGRSLVPAQQAWERQQGFVANASHELRTPLTLMRASAEVALRQLPAQDSDQRALLGDVLSECDHMARLVDDLLLLSRLDAGRLPIERKVVPLPALLGEVERQVGRLAEERGVHLQARTDGSAVWADPARLRQVLLILLDNALRHTPAGGKIRIEAAPRGRQVQVAVVDTGSGIAPEHVPHVFERFYRASSPGADGSAGSGLGLAIARGLILAQQGDIHLASRPGQGTRVELLLPRVEA